MQKSSAAGVFSVGIHRKGAAGKLKAKEKSQENKTGDIPCGSRLADYVYHYLSPLGGITLSSNGTELTGLWFAEQALPIFEQTVRWLDTYFRGKAPDFTPPILMKTTPFRKAVWKIMLEIPFGQTMTYGEIADRLVKQYGLSKMSAQAVGGAVGHNSVSLIIPCHRVVGTNGSLTGYAGGIDKKVRLLELEKADMSSLFVPKKGTAL